LLTSLDKLELLQEREGIGARGVGVRWLLISLGFPDRPERVVAGSSKKESAIKEMEIDQIPPLKLLFVGKLWNIYRSEPWHVCYLWP
jgi:hypothetical protein